MKENLNRKTRLSIIKMSVNMCQQFIAVVCTTLAFFHICNEYF